LVVIMLSIDAASSRFWTCRPAIEEAGEHAAVVERLKG